MSELISYGGGVNTVAMTIRLVNEGWRGPIVFADTGGEHPETYCHIQWFEQNFLQPKGLTITRLSWQDPLPELVEPAYKLCHDKRQVGHSLESLCQSRGIIPLLSVRWCSLMFKRSLIEAWRQYHDIPVSLIGISADESQRAHLDDPAIQYPLLDWGWTRKTCIQSIKEASVPVPPKSGCFFCPSASWRRWRWLWQTHPELYERAAALERNAAARSRTFATLDPGGQFTLDQMKARFEAQDELPGLDMVERNYQPCICGL